MSKSAKKRENAPFTNKVYQALQHIDALDRKRLLRFLESPYFNQRPPLYKLCAYLNSQINKGKPGFDRLLAWQKAAGKIEYDDVNFRKQCSDLLKATERWMAHELLEADESLNALHTLGFVVDRKIAPLFADRHRSAQKAIAQNRSSAKHLMTWQLERYYFDIMQMDAQLDARLNLEEMSEQLDIFYWMEKLKLFIAQLSRRKTGNQVYQLRFLKEMPEWIKQLPLASAPALNLFYCAFLMLSEEERTEHYRAFRAALESHGAGLASNDLFELYDAALLYCTAQINKGKRDFLLEYFDLFEEGLKRGVFLSKGEIAPWRYNNAVAAALGLGKLDWAEQFIRQYRDALPLATRQNTYSFNLARAYRFRGRYDQVLKLLRDLEYEDIGYNLLGKAMVLMSYYELQEFDALFSFIESFRVFLNRHKNIPPARRTSYLNLLRYTRKLTRLLPGDKNGMDKLRKEISDNRAETVNHEWLLEKLDKLS